MTFPRTESALNALTGAKRELLQPRKVASDLPKALIEQRYELLLGRFATIEPFLQQPARGQNTYPHLSCVTSCV